MSLHTPVYILFFTGITAAYWLIPTKRWKTVFLLSASYAFYAAFDLRFAVLLGVLTISNYAIGRMLPRQSNPKALYVFSLLVNLGALGYFKYAGFFLENITNTLAVMGLSVNIPSLSFLLPVGISFYSFQSIAYTTEIYRNKLEPSGLLDFALYLGFFPKLIAGPFVRPKQFLSQVSDGPTKPTWGQLKSAGGLLLTGLVKKVLIADSLASLSASAFKAAGMPMGEFDFNSPFFIQGFYLFAVQIYADFSGYTDIARASAQLLGYHLPENFNQPYTAESLTEFWNRWHMSLTQWFREYIYFPITRRLLQKKGRQNARSIQVFSTLTTMLLIGFWHGANWTFIAWGLWHGIWMSIEQAARIKPQSGWKKVIATLFTFHLVGFGWILFNSSTFAAAWNYSTSMLTFQQMNWSWHYLPSIITSLVLIFSTDYLTSKWKIDSKGSTEFIDKVIVVAALVIVVGLWLLNAAKGTDAMPFLYGQF